MGLARFDDLQAQFAPLVVAPVLLVGDAFCIFDEYAPWAVVSWGAGTAMILFSIGLRGVWRSRLKASPVVAVVAILLAAVVMLVVVPYVQLPSLPGIVLFMVPTLIGLVFWLKILDTPAFASDPAS